MKEIEFKQGDRDLSFDKLPDGRVAVECFVESFDDDYSDDLTYFELSKEQVEQLIKFLQEAL